MFHSYVILRCFYILSYSIEKYEKNHVQTSSSLPVHLVFRMCAVQGQLTSVDERIQSDEFSSSRQQLSALRRSPTSASARFVHLAWAPSIHCFNMFQRAPLSVHSVSLDVYIARSPTVLSAFASILPRPMSLNSITQSREAAEPMIG